jgi:hypothetical protein
MLQAVTSLRSKWMGYVLNDHPDIKLTQLTIPGTHDTATWTLSGGTINAMSAKCQELDLATQLRDGIRFIDIRLVPKHNDVTGKDDLTTYHSSEPCNVWFSDIVSVCRDFLSANDTETIIMSIKNEHDDVSDTDFENALLPFIDNEKQANGVDPLFYVQDAVPKLSESKGQVVLFRRYKVPPGGNRRGINAVRGWPEDNKTTSPTTGNVPMMIQDVYKMATATQGDIKWSQHVNPFIAAAISSPDQVNTLWVNFASASGGGYPITFADEVNPLMQQELEKILQVQGSSLAAYRLGIIVMDFPTPRLIDALIGMNLPNQVHVIWQADSYKMALSNHTAFAGAAFKKNSWNHPQNYPGLPVGSDVVLFSLIKVSGKDSPAIHFGDTVRLMSNEFTNDAYVYIENYGVDMPDGKAGKNLFYDNAEGSYRNDPKAVEWIVERSVPIPSPFQRQFVKPGDAVRFRSVLRPDCYMSAETDQYLAVKPLNYNLGSTLPGGFDWVLQD